MNRRSMLRSWSRLRITPVISSLVPRVVLPVLLAARLPVLLAITAGLLAWPVTPSLADPIAKKIAKKIAEDAGAQKQGALETTPAKELFGYKPEAAKLKARSIGFYSRGCLAGAVRLDPTGPLWQAMRLSRNRNWGHPALIEFVERLAVDARKKDGWPGLLVGDLTQPRGGPMLTGHKSHQIGLDADIWLTPMPDRHLSYEERERISAVSMLKNRLDVNPEVFTDKTVGVIRRAASYTEVNRVGVNPAIKVALCRANGGKDDPWLQKIQSWPGHHYHMHIRLNCPPDSPGCRNQGKPKGTSCAAAETWYARLKKAMENPKPPEKPAGPVKKRKPKPPMTLASLPDDCRTVLEAPSQGGIGDVILPPAPKPTLLRKAAAQGRKLLRNVSR